VIIVAVTASTRRHVAIASEPGASPALPAAQPPLTQAIPTERELATERQLPSEHVVPNHQPETKARK
jgi:hypothetical protein